VEGRKLRPPSQRFADDPEAGGGAEGPPKMVQMWFAGNHSDIGGSYPEAESRLSDNALAWMIAQDRGARRR